MNVPKTAALALSVLSFLSCAPGASDASYWLTTSDAAGIKSGSKVLVLGVEVGQVQRVAIVDQRKVRIHLRVDHKATSDEALLRADACVSTAAVGLLGDKVLKIDPGSLSAPPLRPGEEIHCFREQPNTDDAMKDMVEIARQLADASRNVSTFTHDLAVGEGLLGRLMKDPALAQKFETFLASHGSDAGTARATPPILRPGN